MSRRTLPQLTLYSRPGCHLCDDMKTLIARVAARLPLGLEVVNIDEDPVLTERYGLEIPVLLVDGRKVAKYRIDEAALERTLRARTTA